jgi:vitamin B12 transporter
MSNLTTLTLAALAFVQQPDTVRLDSITVTATRVPMSASALTSSLTVLSGDELRVRGITSVADALRDVPGVTVVQSGSFGGATSLFLRGGESDYVKVLIDGVAVNQPGGSYDFAHLSTENIERIEVLRGPGSVLYGSDATTGVIQIFTREGNASPVYSAGFRGGTFGSVHLDADVTGGTDNVKYSFGVSHFLTEGAYAFNNDYDNTVWSGRVRIDADARTEVALGLRYRDSRFHFPTDGSGNLVDENTFSTDEGTTVSIDAGRWVSDALEVRLLIASHSSSVGADDAPDNAADTLGFFSFRSLQELRRQSVDLRSNLHVDPGIVVTTGVQIERQDERSFNESLSEFGPANASTDEERNTRAAYAQVLTRIQGLSVAVGGRVDDNSAFGTFWTYRGGLGYNFSSGTTVRGSIGRSFKAPTFFENFATGFTVGNPDLRPERSSTVEASVSQSILQDRVALTGAYFHQSFRNLIQYAFDQTPNFSNVAMANAAGLEIELRAEPVRGLRLSGNYTYLDTKVLDAGFDTGEGATFVEGNRLLRRPSHAISGTADVAWAGGAVGMTVHYLGDRDDRDFSTFPATPVGLPRVTTADFWANLNVFGPAGSRPALQATLRIENISDEQYETVTGFPARGRGILVGGRLSGGG